MQKYDVYSLIRSKEIREYFRATWQMGIREQVQLVALGYEDIREKVKILRWVAECVPGSDKDRAQARAVADYLEFCYETATKSMDESVEDDVWDLYTALIHGQEVIYRIEGDEDWLRAQGFAEETLDMVNFGVHSSMFDHHFTLPFERGCRLRLQTPDMEKPYVGLFDPYYLDFDHRCHYVSCENHLYLCQEDSFPVEKSWDDVSEEERVKGNHMIISYHMVWDTGFSLFDWLERV